jgi:hypothetical protein
MSETSSTLCEKFLLWHQNDWLSGLLPSSGILNTRKFNVSETGSVSVLGFRDGTLQTVNLKQ